MDFDDDGDDSLAALGIGVVAIGGLLLVFGSMVCESCDSKAMENRFILKNTREIRQTINSHQNYFQRSKLYEKVDLFTDYKNPSNRRNYFFTEFP
jgi:hypothetical protein